MQCGTVSFVLCDNLYIDIWVIMCYIQQSLFYGRNRKTVQFVTVSAVLCSSFF